MTLIDKAEALAPCPFCGGEARYQADHTTEYRDSVWCGNCDYGMFDPDEQGSVVAAWNRRTIPARGVGVPTEVDREWIDARADELFREAERRRGAVTVNTTRPQDFRDYFVVDATLERFAALAPTDAPDLADPVTVHANMLRGSIAKPTVEQIVHLYGREAFQPMIDVAIAKALEKACLTVSEHADWPEDEHGRTEQVELFARVINAIRAITPAPTDAAHVNETPKSEHDAGNVLTDAALIARLREIQGQAGLFASAAADRIETLAKYRDAYAEMERAASPLGIIAQTIMEADNG